MNTSEKNKKYLTHPPSVSISLFIPVGAGGLIGFIVATFTALASYKIDFNYDLASWAMCFLGVSLLAGGFIWIILFRSLFADEWEYNQPQPPPVPAASPGNLEFVVQVPHAEGYQELRGVVPGIEPDKILTWAKSVLSTNDLTYETWVTKRKHFTQPQYKSLLQKWAEMELVTIGTGTKSSSLTKLGYDYFYNLVMRDQR